MASLLLPSSIKPKILVISSRPRAATRTMSVLPLPSGSGRMLPLFLKASAAPHMPFAPRVSAVSSEIDEEEAPPPPPSENDPSFSPELKLFVGNLPFTVDSAQLAGLFERAGTVEMVEVIYDKLTGKSRGFGFVTMSCIEEVEAAEKQFHGYELEGRSLRVSSGPPPPKGVLPLKASRTGTSFHAINRVYVGNLAWGVDSSALATLFSELGKVMEAKVVYDRDSGRSRGFGFVTYGTAEEVNCAISSLNGVNLDGRNIRVTIAEERPRRPF